MAGVQPEVSRIPKADCDLRCLVAVEAEVLSLKETSDHAMDSRMHHNERTNPDMLDRLGRLRQES